MLSKRHQTVSKSIYPDTVCLLLMADEITMATCLSKSEDDGHVRLGI
ncbi:hypothetical protein [Motiliproteus sp. MSK22-1]|nr:hypothetical protein [Motiliproteus sp. MSK22-1]